MTTECEVRFCVDLKLSVDSSTTIGGILVGSCASVMLHLKKLASIISNHILGSWGLKSGTLGTQLVRVAHVSAGMFRALSILIVTRGHHFGNCQFRLIAKAMFIYVISSFKSNNDPASHCGVHKVKVLY